MRRICFLLLTFLFSLQLFAGETNPIADEFAGTVMQGHIIKSDLSLTDSVGDMLGDTDSVSTSTDLEDQTLPASLAILPLDWHSFPHLYPRVNDGTSVCMLLLRPPPAV